MTYKLSHEITGLFYYRLKTKTQDLSSLLSIEGLSNFGLHIQS